MYPVEQDIDCEYLVYFEQKKNKIKIYKRGVMQLFSLGTMIFFAHESINKTPSKLAYIKANFFQHCQPAQNQPKSQIQFHKNSPLRD